MLKDIIRGAIEFLFEQSNKSLALGSVIGGAKKITKGTSIER
jgi:hypothetical protein